MKIYGIPKHALTVFLIFIVFFSAAPVFAENIFESIARGVKAQFTGDSEIVNLGNNKFEHTDIVSKLKELHQLKQDGVITEEEFILLKKKLIQ